MLAGERVRAAARAPALPVGEKLVAEAAGRRNLPGHAAAEHGIGLAIAAIAPECSHALLIGPEAAVAPAAAAAAVLGAPRIGDIFGACGFHLGREPQQAQRQHDEDASHLKALARRLNNYSVDEIAAPCFPSPFCRVTTSKSSCRPGPRIIGAEGPHVALRVLGGVIAATVVLRHRLARNDGAGRLRAGEMRIHVVDDDVDAHGHATGIARTHQQLTIFGRPHRPEHDHAVAERELRMGDGAALAFVDRLLGKAERPAQERDGCARVLILQRRSDGGDGLLGHTGHGSFPLANASRTATPGPSVRAKDGTTRCRWCIHFRHCLARRLLLRSCWATKTSPRRVTIMAKRTTHRSSTGTKLYAVRDKQGRFKDIQTYKHAHGQDIKRKSKKEKYRHACAQHATALRCRYGAPALRSGETRLIGRSAGRRNLSRHGTAVHGVEFAEAADAPDRGHALREGPEAAVAPAAAAGVVVGAPRIGDVVGARGLTLAAEAEEAQGENRKDASHLTTSQIT